VPLIVLKFQERRY